MRADLSEGSEHESRDNCGQGSDSCHNMSQTASHFFALNSLIFSDYCEITRLVVKCFLKEVDLQQPW